MTLGLHSSPALVRATPGLSTRRLPRSEGDGRMRAHARRWIATSGLLAGACNSIAGLEADYQLAPAAGSGFTEDAGGGSVMHDAGTGHVADTRPEAATEIDGGRSPSGAWCPPLADFCADFETTSNSPPFGWSRYEATSGTLGVVPGQGLRGSRALRATAAAGARTVVLWRQIPSPFGGGKSKVTLSFKFRVAAKTIPYAVLGAIQFSDSEYGVAAYDGPTMSRLDENEPGDRHDFTSAVEYSKGAWYSGEVVVTRSSGGVYGGSVKVDGIAIDDGSRVPFVGPAPATLEVGVGFFFTGDEVGSGEVFFDDVVVRRD